MFSDFEFLTSLGTDLHKSESYDLIGMFNDTSRYLDDIFPIDNLEFQKHIPDIYPAELQLNEGKYFKETSFLDLNIKVIRRDIHTSVYDKRDDFALTHGWVVTFQRLPS